MGPSTTFEILIKWGDDKEREWQRKLPMINSPLNRGVRFFYPHPGNPLSKSRWLQPFDPVSCASLGGAKI